MVADDSIRSSAKRSPVEVSSDDDPFLGQVTPHHLISPTLRRVKGARNDPPSPPSDDSVMSDSPSRDVVRRRLGVHRLGGPRLPIVTKS
jgi:hypothetical protein